MAHVTFPKPRPRVLDRLEYKRTREKAQREARAAVWTRAESRCERCGKWCSRSAVDSLKAGHVHHKVYRSRGGSDDPTNLELLCAICHAKEHGV